MPPLSNQFWEQARKRIIAGILVWVPIVITFLVLRYLFNSLDGILSPLIKHFVGFKIPGLGIIAALLLLYATGVAASLYLGDRLIKLGDRILDQVPIVKNIYQATKQFLQTITSAGKMQFKRVVIAKYPHPGLRAIGFVTGSSKNPEGQTFLHVFIPSTPNPTSGMLELIREAEVEETKLSVEEGLKLVISGGILAPDELTKN